MVDLCVLIHNLLQVFQQMVIGATFFLIDVHDPIQVWEVPVQIYSLGVASTHKPILELTRLKKKKITKMLSYSALCNYKVSIHGF